MIGEEFKFTAKYEPKDAKWKVLCELPSGDAFVEESNTLVLTLARAATRAMDST